MFSWHEFQNMEEPIEPNKEDCCNSGCNPCIFDVYEKQLNLYRQLKNCPKNSLLPSVGNGMSQIEYRSFAVAKAYQITNLIKIIKFRKVKINANEKVWWKPGYHFLVRYNSQHNACTRAYTPLRCDKDDKELDFYIILKKYENGLVSKSLFNLNVGDETWWRGPYGSYEIESNKYLRILMIAQGTGLAPFISIIERILDNEDDMTKLILYFCSHDVESILLRNQLYSYNSYWNFSYKIFVGKYSNESIKYEEPIVKRKLMFKDLEDFKPCSTDQFLLCGSKEFMNEFKKLLLNVHIYEENIVLF